MRKAVLVLCFSALVIGFMPRSAAALTAVDVTCPDMLSGGLTNQYTVSKALDCVYSNSALNGQPDNIGQGAGDGFLTGTGLEESAYGDATTAGSTFGKTWTMICSSGTAAGACSGLSITNIAGPGGGTSANWQVTNSAYQYYALGVKDGSDPKWAVFLLDSSLLSGTVSMVGGGFSHFVLYGSGTPITSTNQNLDPVPEPASLLLLSSGLAFAGNRLRKRRARQTAAL